MTAGSRSRTGLKIAPFSGAARGVVFDPKGAYRTAFFEAFPTDPATFIRGEGVDVPAAEMAAWAKFACQRDCAGHELERRGYRNGAGICKHCGLFVSRAFEPLEEPDDSSTLLGRAFSGDTTALNEIFTELLAEPGVPESKTPEAPE